MNEPSSQDLKLEQAKLLYMQYRPVAEIARQLDVVPATIYWHVSSNGWKDERSKQLDHLIKDIAETSKEQLAKLWAIGLPLIVKSVLTASKNNQGSLTIKEAKELSDIMINFQKLQSVNIEDAEGRLASNKTKHLTVNEIKEIFLSDKFLDIEMREVNGTSGAVPERKSTDTIGPEPVVSRQAEQDGTASGKDHREPRDVGATVHSNTEPDASTGQPGSKDPFTSEGS